MSPIYECANSDCKQQFTAQHSVLRLCPRCMKQRQRDQVKDYNRRTYGDTRKTKPTLSRQRYYVTACDLQEMPTEPFARTINAITRGTMRFTGIGVKA